MAPPVLTGPQRKELAAIRKLLKSLNDTDIQQGYALALAGPGGAGPTEAVFTAMVVDNFAWVNRAVKSYKRAQVRAWLMQQSIRYFPSLDAQFQIDGIAVVGGALQRNGAPVKGLEALKALAWVRREGRAGEVRSLDLSQTAGPFDLADLTALEGLDLSRCSNLNLDQIARIGTLRRINLSHIYNLPPLDALLKLPPGLALDLTGSNINAAQQFMLDLRAVQAGDGADARLGIAGVRLDGGRLVNGQGAEVKGRQAMLALARARREGWHLDIEALDLSGAPLRDLDMLAGMDRLRRLDVRGCDIQRADVIATLASLSEFHGSGRMPLPPVFVDRRRAANAALDPRWARLRYEVGGVAFELVSVPAGERRIGDARAAIPREGEAPRTVAVGPLAVAVTPVTQALYAAVTGRNPAHFQGAHGAQDGSDGERPVEQVNWYDAIRFCNALSAAAGLRPAYTVGGEGAETSVEVRRDPAADGFRLPTNDEWEAAARAGQDAFYAGSDTAEEVGWSWRNSGDRTQPVGRLAPNAWGLHDMSGNVWEWTEDSDAGMPHGGQGRCYRGGAWLYHADMLRVSAVNHADPGARYPTLGLRVVRGL